jgi:AGZA family xanthine/uracil permease-like MFS transporter
MKGTFEHLFKIDAAGSTVGREAVAGLTTFATLSYILFVQPAVLANPAVGMDADGVLFATCVASAAACFLMAWWTNYPFALAPAMGHNFFFAFTVCIALGFRWQEALAANLIAGLAFLILTPTGFREHVMDTLPGALKGGIAAGIGLLIALVGLEWGGIVVDHPATLIGLGDLGRPVALLALFGLVLNGILLAARVPGALLIGILGTALAGWAASEVFALDPALVSVSEIVGAPPSPVETAFRLDFVGLFSHSWDVFLTVIVIFFFLDLFDSVGSLVGLGQQAGLMKGGRLPRARGALAADASGTVIGAVLGTSSITSYVESTAGIAVGGRTGLVAVVVGLCFIVALFLNPLIHAIGAGVMVATEPNLVVAYPVVAPVLILIGAFMMRSLKDVDWPDPCEAIPAFLTAIVMPLTFSITEGIAWGFVSYSILSLVRRRRAPIAVHVIAVLFVLRYVFLET